MPELGPYGPVRGCSATSLPTAIAPSRMRGAGIRHREYPITRSEHLPLGFQKYRLAFRVSRREDGL